MILPRSYLKLTTFFQVDFMLEWTKKYGNIFQMRLLTNTEVRAPDSCPWSIKKIRLQFVTVEPHHVKVLEPSRFNIYILLTRCSFVKAILSTQFDAFGNGKWHVSHMAETRIIITSLGPILYSQFESLLGEIWRI